MVKADKNGPVTARECDNKHLRHILWTLGIVGVIVVMLWNHASAAENRITTLEVQMQQMLKMDEKLDALLDALAVQEKPKGLSRAHEAN